MDPAIHNSNTRVFRGRRLELKRPDPRVPEDEALEAIRRFVAEFATQPTAKAWTAAAMAPSEKTIRRRYGSFKAAIAAALGSVIPVRKLLS